MRITEENFAQLIDTSQYQVFVMHTPISLPFPFFVHTYIVTNRHGQIDRWELWHRTNKKEGHLGHIHQNAYPAWVGNSILFEGYHDRLTPRFSVQLAGCVSGHTDSIAHQMTDFIDKHSSSYAFRSTYRPYGPNSNTFTQWILDHFPESGISLPRRAYGCHNHVQTLSMIREK